MGLRVCDGSSIGAASALARSGYTLHPLRRLTPPRRYRQHYMGLGCACPVFFIVLVLGPSVSVTSHYQLHSQTFTLNTEQGHLARAHASLQIAHAVAVTVCLTCPCSSSTPKRGHCTTGRVSLCIPRGTQCFGHQKACAAHPMASNNAAPARTLRRRRLGHFHEVR